MGEPFHHELRVRYAECDPQGIVFNAHYLAYFDIALTELWRAAFGGYAVMTDRGVDLVVAEAQVRFRAPARFDDRITLAVAVSRLGESSVATRHTIERAGEPVAEGRMRHVCVDAAALRKAAIPDWLREGLAPWSVVEAGADSESAGTPRA
jgi:acyl-CoA thioester hydrolase